MFYGNVKVLGTFITEWDEGKATCKELLATKESAQMYAERLAELAAALGFDGWLVIFLFAIYGSLCSAILLIIYFACELLLADKYRECNR